MKLQRVQVPDFRVLKNVDISFEKDFVPNIFPLGSQNGGGKSTLLQLIFVLLHCSGDSDKHEFIKNMLYGFGIDADSQKRVLAKFDIWDGEKTVNLEFVAYKDSSVKELFTQDYSYDPRYEPEYLVFSVSSILKDTQNDIINHKKEISQLQYILEKIQTIKNIKYEQKKEFIYDNLKQEIQNIQSINKIKEKYKSLDNINIGKLNEEINNSIEEYNTEIAFYNNKLSNIKKCSEVIHNYLTSNNMKYISKYKDLTSIYSEEEVLVCHIHNIEIHKVEYFFKNLSCDIFLAAPSTQIFLFLTKDSRNLLFKQHNNGNIDNYYSQLKLSKSKLSSFFTYDFLAVDLLIDIFKSARDKDFKQAIETGKYGNNYQLLVNDLNQILLNKKININPDLYGFTFKLDAEGQDIELYPEDLSHGELKRLSIYAWIRYNIIEDSIVLIDEIENGFHPDWQYQIIRDIAEWAPENQYIISTHSYELCQAVTPAHVKELEPRLIKQESES